jgi:hypothetical protein
MPKERLRAKLAEFEEQREDLRKVLRETQDRQKIIKRLEWERDHNLHLVDAFGGAQYITASPRDRRRIYEALRLRVEIDKEGRIRLSGIFNPPLLLNEMVQDPPVDPSEPLPKVPEDADVEVLTLDNTPTAGSSPSPTRSLSSRSRRTCA